MKIITIDELLKMLDGYNHTELHIHHTFKPDHKDFKGNNHIQLQQAMKNYHINTRGWDNIAQHVTLAPDGLFVTGRPFNSQPASIYGKNGSPGKIPFMVEMIGNFDIGNDKLEGKQLDSIIKLARYFYSKNKYIRFHRENAAKTCPGTGIDKDKFMEMVKMSNTTPKIDDIAGHWAEKEIRAVLASGKMQGFPDGTFRPDEPLTRAQLAWLIANNKI